jgi:uncharacterized membrane protein YkvI
VPRDALLYVAVLLLVRLERTFMGPSDWLTLLFGVLGLPGAALSMLLLYEWVKKSRESKRKPE